jgi:hypothetical protein
MVSDADTAAPVVTTPTLVGRVAVSSAMTASSYRWVKVRRTGGVRCRR